MNEKTNAGAHETTRARGCGRAADLVAYLYGEAIPAEARDFRLHLDACAVCRDELAALGGVRERVGEWHAEALGAAPALDLGGAFAPASQALADAPPAAVGRVRSARAALREFFALAPLWLRAGAAAAVLAVCALTALTLARTSIRWDADGLAFDAGVSERIVDRVESAGVPSDALSPAQVEAVVRERVRQELAAAERRKEQREQEAAADTPDAALKKPAPRLEEVSNRNAPPRRRAVPRLTRRNRPQPEDEENLPRLSDLLGGIY